MSGKGTGVVQLDWVRDILSFEGSWLHLAVVDPWNDLCYFNSGRDEQNNNKRAPPVGL
jgi:hypothetical protein